MAVLTIDRGNTFTKLGVFIDSELEYVVSVGDSGLLAVFEKLVEEYHVRDVVYSSVRNDLNKIRESDYHVLNWFLPNHQSLFPFSIDYDNSATIGLDRLANAAGALKLKGKSSCLVVDCGTCTTYTLVANGTMKGGAISPGINMRLKALHHFTGQLPLLSPKENLVELPGRSTEDSIRAGVEYAAILEADALIEHFCNDSPDLNVLLTGGGMTFFERHLKSPTFAAPYLTLEGLYEIFILNNDY